LHDMCIKLLLDLTSP